MFSHIYLVTAKKRNLASEEASSSVFSLWKKFIYDLFHIVMTFIDLIVFIVIIVFGAVVN